MNLEQIKGKRIAAIDYGKRRIGLALSDELHIIAQPKTAFENIKDETLPLIADYIRQNNVGLILVGVPFRNDDKNNKLINEIRTFIKHISEMTQVNVIERDESFSSQKAKETMINIGKKQKYRQHKENTDMFAAAIILKEFLDEVS